MNSQTNEQALAKRLTGPYLKGLKEPEFIQEENFKSIIWRTLKSTGQVTGQATGQVSGEPTGEPGGEDTDHVTVHVTVHDTDHVEDLVKRLLLILVGEMSRPEIMEMLGLKHRPNFMGNYIQPALDADYIEMTLPDKLTSINQKYRLTAKGIALKQQLENKK